MLVAFVRTESNADILNKDVQRTIDLTTQLVKVSNLITVENQGTSALRSYTFVVEPSQADHLAYLSAKVLVVRICVIVI
jgi:oligosaccharyltransferase complex subunit alpha (ribophorin I)